MTEPRLRHVQCLDTRGLHRMAYWEWGDPANRRVLVCVHGLSRQGRDFDTLAADLCGTYRVVCPDVVGRGQSDWLADPTGYAVPAYVADMVTLLARLDAEVVDWVGTSMGGLLGMMLAAQPQTPIARLVINDVGPLVPRASLERLAQYVGKAGTFRDQAALEIYLRQVHAPFGPLTDAQWRHLAQHSAQRSADGSITLAYDPAIAAAFAGPLNDVVL